MRYSIFLLLFCCCLNLRAQKEDLGLSSLLFWTAQDWPCESIEIDVYNRDSLLVGSVNLKQKFTENRIPECTDERIAKIDSLTPGFYFFVAECYKAKCSLCQGEGSFWQPIMQDKSIKSTGVKNKGNMDGTWKTCYLCQGDGASSSTLWIDTLTLEIQQCRSVLLK